MSGMRFGGELRGQAVCRKDETGHALSDEEEEEEAKGEERR